MKYQLKKILQLSPPLISNNLLGLILPLTATFFIAKLGTIELAALAIGSVTNLLFNNFVSAGVSSIGILASSIYKQKQQNKSNELFFTTLSFATLFSLIPALLLWLLPELFLVLKWHLQLLPFLKKYFFWCGIALVITAIYMSIIQFMLGYNKAKLTTISNLVKILLAIPLNYYFILGRYHFGISSIPITQIIIQSILILILTIYLTKTYSLSFPGFKYYSLFPVYNKLLKIGLPLAMQVGFDRGIMLVATYMIGFFGVDALAAAQLATQCALVVAAIQGGVTDACTLLISRSNRVEKYYINPYLQNTMLLTITIALAFFFLAYFTNEQKLYLLANKYNHSAQVAYLGRQFLLISLIALLIQGVRNSYAAIFNGLHKTRLTMLISTITAWSIALPVAYFMGFILPGGILWLRWGLTASYPIAILFFVYFYSRLK